MTNIIGIVLGLIVAAVGFLILLNLGVMLAAGIVFGWFLLIDNNFFLRPGEETLSKKRERFRDDEQFLKQARRNESWVDGVIRRTQQIRGAQWDVVHRGSVGSRILLKVTDPSGCVSGYTAWWLSRRWDVSLFEIEGSFGIEAAVDDYIHWQRSISIDSPWVVSVSGVFAHQIILDPIEYGTEYPERS